MKIKFKEPDLEWTYMSYCDNEKDHKDGVEMMISDFNKHIEFAEQIHHLIKNRQNLTDEEFIENLKSFCYFDLDYKDMLRILSSMADKKFIKDEEIRTTMVKKRDLGYMTEYTCFDMNVACTEKADIKYLKFYSVEQLNYLINSGEIVVLDVFKTTKGWLDELDEQYRIENPVHFDIPFNHDRCCSVKFPTAKLDLDYYLTDMSDEFKLAFYKYIRKNLKTIDLITCLKKYLERFNRGFESCVTPDILNRCIQSNKFAEICKLEFDEKGCTERLKQLSLVYKK